MTPDEENLLDDLPSQDSGLTAWEMDFIESLDARRKRPLTPKQRNRLNEIAEKLDLGGVVR